MIRLVHLVRRVYHAMLADMVLGEQRFGTLAIGNLI